MMKTTAFLLLFLVTTHMFEVPKASRSISFLRAEDPEAVAKQLQEQAEKSRKVVDAFQQMGNIAIQEQNKAAIRKRLNSLGMVAAGQRMSKRRDGQEQDVPRFVNTATDIAPVATFDAHLQTLLEREEQNNGDTRLDGGWSSHLREILCGTRYVNSTLSQLSGLENSSIVRAIYTELVTTWKDSVTRTLPAHMVGRMNAESVFYNDDLPEETERDDYFRDNHRAASIFMASPYNFAPVGCTVDCRPRIAFSSCGSVQFPAPADRNVNMMPFVLGDKESLPEELQPYYDSCVANCPVMADEMGTICYLTVAEGFVSASETQRRGGLHVEAPGSYHTDDSPHFVAGLEHRWGCGIAFEPDELHGGIFMASNMPDTSAVWNALVDTSTGAVNSHGGMDHLRPYLGPSTKLAANELVWFTDKTPHEALPQTKDGYRQFFRVVTSGITLWFADHSTPNPKCPLPKHIQIIQGSKF